MGLVVSHPEKERGGELALKQDIEKVRAEAGKLFFISSRPSEREGNSEELLSLWGKGNKRIVLENDTPDESLSKSTESTQGSPNFYDLRDAEITNRHASRRAKSDSAHDHGKHGWPRGAWFRRSQSSGLGARESSASSESNVVPAEYVVIHESNPYRSRTPSVPIMRSRSRDDLCSPRLISVSKDDEDLETLQRIYDLRTWDMYIRITEARKNTEARKACIPSSPATAYPADYGNFHFVEDMDPLEMTEPEARDNEMIFGDMDDC